MNIEYKTRLKSNQSHVFENFSRLSSIFIWNQNPLLCNNIHSWDCTCIASLLYSRGSPNGLSSPPTTIPGWQSWFSYFPLFVAFLVFVFLFFVGFQWQSCFSYHLFSLASNLKQCCFSYFLFFFKTEAGVQLLGSKTYCRSKAPLLQIIELPKNCVVIFYKPTILAFS